MKITEIKTKEQLEYFLESCREYEIHDTVENLEKTITELVEHVWQQAEVIDNLKEHVEVLNMIIENYRNNPCII